MKKNLNIFIPIALALMLGSLTYMFAQSSDTSSSKPLTEAQTDFGPPPPGGFRGGPSGHGGPGGPGGFTPMLLDQLSLSDTQKEQVRAYESAARETSKEHFSRITAADEQLRLMVDSGTFTDARARPIVKAKSNAMAELELIRLGTEASIQQLLTTEQKTQLVQLKGKRPSFPPGGGFRPGER